VLTLYGFCRWLIGHEGKISSVGGLAARYPAAAYIQMKLKVFSRLHLQEAAKLDRGRREEWGVRSAACGITQFMLSPNPNCIWSWLICAWPGQSQIMLPCAYLCGVVGRAAKQRKKPIPRVVKVWIKGERCREKGSLTLTLCVHITSDHAMINRSTGAMDKGLLQLTKVVRSSCRLQLPGPSSSAASSAPMTAICNIRQSR